MDQKNDFFQVSVKGMFFNEENKLMMIQEENGEWELPGGRIRKGEDLIDCLKRECIEETGLECQVLENQPSIVYTAIDQEGLGRVMIYYKIHLNSLDFKISDECVDIKFYTKDEIKKLKMCPQIQKLPDYF